MSNLKLEFSCDVSKMDLNVIYDYLHQSYWSPGIPREVVEKGVANSLCFAVFYQSRQVGFARLITDRATFAYLADVFVLPALQGQGIGKRLMQFVMEHPDVSGLRRMMLATRDAHQLYEQVGFTALGIPERFMERHQPDVYQSALNQQSKVAS